MRCQKWEAVLLLGALVVAAHPALGTDAEAEKPTGKADPADDFTPELLAEWIARNGGKGSFTLKENEDGVRGLYTLNDVKKGETFLTVPYKLGITLGDATAGSPAHATTLLMHMATYMDWQRFMEPYWLSLPRGGLSFSKFTMAPQHLSLLQSEELAAAAEHQQNKAEVEYKINALPQMPGLEDTVSLDYFKHLSSVMSTYTLSFPNHENGLTTYMVPALDMMNHAASHAANAEVQMLDDAFGAIALKDIKAGEEITQMYSDALERNDMSLMHYGFIQRHEPPRLLCIDRPGGDLYDDSSCPLDDSDYEAGGRFCNVKELDRLTHIFGSFPTTQEEDVKLLEGDSLDSVQRVMVSFRLLRKRALHATILKLQDALGTTSSLAAKNVPDNVAR